MLVFNAIYKDKKGICLKTNKLEAVVLPDEGGKMVSLKAVKNWEEILAQAPGEKYLALTPGDRYVDSECSAFDDMFPTIDFWHNGIREYEDHGEVCRRPYNVKLIEGDDIQVEMYIESPAGDYLFTKTYCEKAGSLQINYSCRNLTDKPLPVLWAAHFMMAAKEGRRVLLSTPENGQYEATCMFWDGKEGADGVEPVGKGQLFTFDSKSGYLKSDAYNKEGSAYKFYLNNKYTDSFIYGNVILKCENAPYLGIWINNGPFKGMYNVAAEFCTAGFDTPGAAMEHGHDVYVPAGQERKWSFNIDIM